MKKEKQDRNNIAFYPVLKPLIDKYLSATEKFKKERKILQANKNTKKINAGEYKKSEKELFKENVWTPLKELSKLDPLGENPYKHGTEYPFISESIWIDKELDIKRLNYNRDKYEINVEDGKPLNPNKRNIFLFEELNKYLKREKEAEKKAKAKGINLSPIRIDAGDVSIKELYENPGYYSDKELYVKRFRHLAEYGNWLEKLTENKMKSTDLLDQILICYTIKRNYNGDKKAFKKLYNLYKRRAKSHETIEKVRGLISYQLRREYKNSLHNQYKKEFDDATAKKKAKEDADKKSITIPIIDDLDEIQENITKKLTDDVKDKEIVPEDTPHEELKQHEIAYDGIPASDIIAKADTFLWLIISGFSPEAIIKSLINGTDDKELPVNIEELCFAYFSEYLPQKINKILSIIKQNEELFMLINLIQSNCNIKNKELEEIKEELLNTITAWELNLIVSLNPYTPIRNSTYLLNKKGKFRFNNLCYRPSKMGPRNNLTLWLFGSDESPEYGKLYQMLRDYFLPEVRTKKGEITLLEEDSEYIKEREKQFRSNSVIEQIARAEQQKNTKNYIKKIAKKCNMSINDLNFLLDYHSGEYTQDDLAQKYKLTKDQVRYECSKLFEKMQKFVVSSKN